ncbi:MAG: sigma-70 family RNA polymerase sigma factor [Actinobacteria bacterium]|nr:sigma-70 family RNA polymerase sigma factor [Actinomycetota bacterium]
MTSYGEVDESTLVGLARLDMTAFAELYRRNVQTIYAFAHRRTGNAQQAEDITAITFERALRSLHTYQANGSGFIAWLTRIATNEIIDQARRRQRQHSERGQRALRLLHEQSFAPDEDDDHGDPALIAALARLPRRYNTVLSLRFVGGLTPSEVATHLGISPTNCAVLTHRALAALRKELDGGNMR